VFTDIPKIDVKRDAQTSGVVVLAVPPLWTSLTRRQKVSGWDCGFCGSRYTPWMITLRDHRSGTLFDPWEYLGPPRRRLLERSWAGVFRKHLLTHLPVVEVAPHLCHDFGRPSKDLYTVLGALILQQLHNLTDAATVEALAFNIAWHYALDIRSEADAYVCERTLRNYRRLVIEKQLEGVLFRGLTDELIRAFGIDTGGADRLDDHPQRYANAHSAGDLRGDDP
jgi:hypothetical protein